MTTIREQAATLRQSDNSKQRRRMWALFLKGNQRTASEIQELAQLLTECGISEQREEAIQRTVLATSNPPRIEYSTAEHNTLNAKYQKAFDSRPRDDVNSPEAKEARKQLGKLEVRRNVFRGKRSQIRNWYENTWPKACEMLRYFGCPDDLLPAQPVNPLTLPENRLDKPPLSRLAKKIQGSAALAAKERGHLAKRGDPPAPKPPIAERPTYEERMSKIARPKPVRETSDIKLVGEA